MGKDEERGSVFDSAPPRLFSIDSGRPFLSDLADELIQALGERLPSAEIFLPTRRAVRAAGDAFLDAYERRGVRAALLPRFKAIGDIEEDELAVFAGAAADELKLLPAIPAADRLVALARLVAARERAFVGRENWPAAIAAARELGKLLDSFYVEEIDPASIGTLDVADAAGHWKRSLDFLEIVTAAWPAHLEEIGRTDLVDRRTKLIAATAQRFREAPPVHPLIIAGTTASAPAVARLVAAIAQAPVGAAILPGLDRTLDARGWSAVDDAHPQSGLKALLDRLGVAPDGVAAWPKSGPPSRRAALLRLALRPAEATDEWLDLIAKMTEGDAGLAAATKGLSLVEADNEESEATVIAALFRETAETEEETAVLVTPDRNLARRVALKMQRWGILVDDSAGVPFANSRCGTFLRLVALWIDNPDDPVALLAMLRHPLARLGLAFRERAFAIDSLDRGLRGKRKVASCRAQLSQEPREDRPSVIAGLFAALDEAAGLFPRENGASFAAQFAGHLAAAERLAGASLLWSGEDGETGAELLAGLQSAAAAVAEIGGSRYPDIFAALIADAAVRRRTNAHPRLAILGPLEARLQNSGHVILGGLNEGVWPAGAASDPFLSRPMRKSLGLPSPERRIGLSAHDFAQGAAQPRVTLTRARRAGGKPAEPSRWMIRLKNILTGADAMDAVDRSEYWRCVLAALDAPDLKAPAPAGRPRPAAGPGRRPQRLSVTDIEQWLRDPYAIYARHLLSLRRLDEPGAPIDPRALGSLLHKVFELAARRGAAPTEEFLQAIFEAEAQKIGLEAAERRFWSTTIAGALEWYVAFDADRRAAGRIGLVEEKGEWTIPGVDPPFVLSATADRIDILKAGGAAIFDYKLRRIPSEKQIKNFSAQLPLTGAIVEAGGFAALGRARVASYAYHRVVDRNVKSADLVHEKTGDDASSAIAEAAARLKAWIDVFDDPSTPYHSQPRPEFSFDVGDYDQLARRKEWAAEEETDE